MSEEITIKKVSSLITPQLIIYIFGGIVAIVIFWTRTQESWAKVKELERNMATKADQADVKAVEDRVNRQYEQIGKTTERVNALEKQQEYQRGRSDEIKETKN